MNDLEQYIRDHAVQFDSETPAPGHEERFLARLDAAGSPRPRPAALFRRPAVRAFALAAAAIALLLVLRPEDLSRLYGPGGRALPEAQHGH